MRALRAGNWKHWIQAMRDATDSNHFDVRLGVSGYLELPMAIGRPCNVSRSLKIEMADGSSIPIPAHIWAHVHALEKTGGVQDEFVIIGHNSPFVRTYIHMTNSLLIAFIILPILPVKQQRLLPLHVRPGVLAEEQPVRQSPRVPCLRFGAMLPGGGCGQQAG